ncbi:hypothetical protein ACFV5G_09115 [Streptomyces sp. NPDC059766]|uniref:hypothetical protein n=1 Tax=Streptomyces sp. NPDC059766 TaxID=3346940 RepID=UPI003647F969
MNAPTSTRINSTTAGRGDRGSDESARSLLRKLLITVATGGGAYVLTNVISPGPDDLWRVVLSVLFGGAILIVQFMITFAQQLGELRGVVEQRFVDIGEATKLFNEVEQLRGDGVPRLAEYATKVVANGPKILHDFAGQEIERLAGFMYNFANLNAKSPGENHDWLLTLTKCATTSIDAISTSPVDGDFWNSEPAGRYLEAQRVAIDDPQRRVKVRRLFVVKQPEDIATLDALCEEQRGIGIEVRVVALPHLPINAQRGKMIDFIIFDGALSYEITADQMGVPSWTTVDATEKEVQERVKRFAELWSISQNGIPDSVRATTTPPEPGAS